MAQGEASNPQTYKVKGPKSMLTSKGHSQHPKKKQKHQKVQGPRIPNSQHNQNPLDIHVMYQQQQEIFSKQQEKLRQ